MQKLHSVRFIIKHCFTLTSILVFMSRTRLKTCMFVCLNGFVLVGQLNRIYTRWSLKRGPPFSKRATWPILYLLKKKPNKARTTYTKLPNLYYLLYPCRPSLSQNSSQYHSRRCLFVRRKLCRCPLLIYIYWLVSVDSKSEILAETLSLTRKIALIRQKN